MLWEVRKWITLEGRNRGLPECWWYSIFTPVWDSGGGFFMKIHWAVHCDACTLIICYTGATSPNENEIKWVFLKGKD